MLADGKTGLLILLDGNVVGCVWLSFSDHHDAKAHEFYLGFLGFSVDWEHRYGERFPLYTQVSRGGLRLHLSEHAGDATPGGNMVVYMKGIRAFQKELIGKDYPYMRPGLEDEGTRLEVTVTDPFQNRIRFMELKD